MRNLATSKGEYDETPFGIIKGAEILTSDDLQCISDLSSELKENFLKSQVFRTRTEMEISVLNEVKHPTPASKYWQAVREQNVMFHELVMLSYDYRKNLVEIKMLQRDLKKEKDSLKKELLQIEIDKKLFLSKSHEKIAKDRIREVRSWSEIKQREAKKLSKEELEDVDTHQLISYTKRWIKQASILTANASHGERQNLLGQLWSGIEECNKRGLLSKVLEEFDHSIPIISSITERYVLKK